MEHKKKNTLSIYEGDYLPLYAKEIEEAVLGALMLESNAINNVIDKLDAESFYYNNHQQIYQAILELYKASEPIDMITVVEKLNTKGYLEEIGGAYFIASLTDKIASAAHLEKHSRIIKEFYIKRQTILKMRESEQQIKDGEDIGDVLFQIRSDNDILYEKLVGNQTTLHIRSALKEAAESMYNRKELSDKGVCSGISTGLKDLDKIINGWQNSELVVIASRPAMGKTAMCLHFAKAAAKQNKSVTLFSLEMSKVSLADRLILSKTNISPEKYRAGKLSKEETNEIEKAIGKLCQYPIYIDDNPCVSMSYIRSKSRLLKSQNRCDIVMIDYLQLANEAKDKTRNREQEIAQMSREAKIIAKELNVPVILLSQLNRSVESRADKKPLLSDLRESGAIEQDADMVMFIHRPEYYGINVKDMQGNDLTNYGELIIAKNRNGATSTIPFRHDGTLNRIYDFNYNS